jgi:hypothetical protein
MNQLVTIPIVPARELSQLAARGMRMRAGKFQMAVDCGRAAAWDKPRSGKAAEGCPQSRALRVVARKSPWLTSLWFNDFPKAKLRQERHLREIGAEYVAPAGA